MSRSHVNWKMCTCALETSAYRTARSAGVVDVDAQSILRGSQVQEIDEVVWWCRIVGRMPDICETIIISIQLRRIFIFKSKFINEM